MPPSAPPIPLPMGGAPMVAPQPATVMGVLLFAAPLALATLLVAALALS
jgi:hypothetical protein